MSADCGDFSGTSVTAAIWVDCCDHRDPSRTLIFVTFSVHQVITWTGFEEGLFKSSCSGDDAYHCSAQIIQICGLSAGKLNHGAYLSVSDHC